MAGDSYEYVVLWYNEAGNRFQTQPMRSSEGAAAIARSKIQVGYVKVTIRVNKV